MILFDTNIFIDMLNGVREATIELGNYDSPAISVITYMELRAGEVLHPLDAPILNAILAEFEIIAVSREVQHRRRFKQPATVQQLPAHANTSALTAVTTRKSAKKNLKFASVRFPCKQ